MKNALTFTLRLLEPLLATQPQSSEANSATTLSYIPGSMIRGAVIGCSLNGAAMNAADEEAQRLFFSGAVQFLNAYPAHPTQRDRMLPRPLSWLIEKDEAGRKDVPLRDMAIQDWQLDNPKTPEGQFIWHGQEGIQLDSPHLHVTVHTASRDRNRKAEQESQVYRYEALAAGQTFAGVIAAERASDLALIEPWLKAVTRLGGARTGGYGHVVAEDIERSDDWEEYSSDAPLADRVVITLLSDVLLRDGGGNMTDAPGRALGISTKPMLAFRRLHVVGGFNRKWGLPLPQGWAIEAGSVFVYSAADVDPAALQQAAKRGIGERLAEGFGRIAVDWHTQAAQAQRPPEKPTVETNRLPAMSAESKGLAQRMARRQLEAQIERNLVAQIIERTGGSAPFGNLPSPAQLSRARLAVRQAWETGDLAVISAHFASLKSAENDWKRARIGEMRLLEWIEQQRTLDDATFKRQFGLVAAMPEVAGETAETASADWQMLRAKTIARLVEGVLKQAIKHKKELQEGGRP